VGNDDDITSATGSADSGIALMESTFGSEPNTTDRAHMHRIERRKVEQKVQERLEAARAEWEAERLATAEGWRKEVETQAKAVAMDEVRAELEIEKRIEERTKAAQEERKKVEAELRAKIEKEAIEKVKEDMKKEIKPPIRFKDAIGRKYSFPFHLVQTWTGMEELIKQAFLHVEVVGPQVMEGNYDLIGPDGEIVLPTVWERVVMPDWHVTMHMWPMERMPQPLRPRQARPAQPAFPPGGGRTRTHIPGHGHGSRPDEPDIIEVGPLKPLRSRKAPKPPPPPVYASDTEDDDKTSSSSRKHREWKIGRKIRPQLRTSRSPDLGQSQAVEAWEFQDDSAINPSVFGEEEGDRPGSDSSQAR